MMCYFPLRFVRLYTVRLLFNHLSKIKICNRHPNSWTHPLRTWSNDEVLMLLPDKTNILLSSRQGLFTVIKQCSPVNYIIDVWGNHKLFHINMLKRYYSLTEDQVEEISTNTSSDVKRASTVSVIDNIDEENNDDGFSNDIPYPVLKQSESWKDVHIDDDIQDPYRSHISHVRVTFQHSDGYSWTNQGNTCHNFVGQ